MGRGQTSSAKWQPCLQPTVPNRDTAWLGETSIHVLTQIGFYVSYLYLYASLYSYINLILNDVNQVLFQAGPTDDSSGTPTLRLPTQKFKFPTHHFENVKMSSTQQRMVVSEKSAFRSTSENVTSVESEGALMEAEIARRQTERAGAAHNPPAKGSSPRTSE